MPSPRQKATVYALNAYGQPFRSEINLVKHGRHVGTAQHWSMGLGPFVYFTKPPRRKVSGFDRADQFPYLLILAGHGHPQTIPVSDGRETNAHRDPTILKPWDDLIDEHIRTTAARVLGDYRDMTRPDFPLRLACADEIERLVWSDPDEARRTIDRYEDESRARGCHDPECWDGVRRALADRKR